MMDLPIPKHTNRSWRGVLTSILIFVHISVVEAYPRSRIVRHGSKECLYDKLEEDEHLTMSMFISHGDYLEATAVMEGPVAPADANTGKEITDAVHKFGRKERYSEYRMHRGDVPGPDHGPVESKSGTLVFSEQVNFEMTVEEFDDDDDLAQMRRMDLEAFDDEAKIHEYHQRVEDMMTRKTRNREESQKRMDGEPFEKTVQAFAAGWYRVCVVPSRNQVTVEMEMRKSSELGTPNEDTGWHVPTEEEYIEVEEDAEIDENAAKEEDLEKSKEYLKQLYHQLTEIKKRQTHEVHRMQIHKELNSHSHSSMVLGSLLETVLFIAVTGFQVHTIRKWFAGGPMLGR